MAVGSYQYNLFASAISGALTAGITSNSGTIAQTISGNIISATETIPTSTTALANGGITGGALGQCGIFAFQNTDATNYVILSTDNASAVPFAWVEPGRTVVIPNATITLYAKAHTAGCVCTWLWADY